MELETAEILRIRPEFTRLKKILSEAFKKGEAHAALDDVRMCAALLRFLILMLKHKGAVVDTWEQLAVISDEARIPTVMSFGKHKGPRIEDVPSDYVRWYRGQVDKDEWLLKAFARAGK